MTVVGRVRQIWRFPVKSMLGEELPRCTVGPKGIPGDRGYALRNEEVGEMCGAKKFPVLMQCSARYRSEPEGDTIPPADIVLPGGDHTASDSPTVGAALSALIGKSVTLWPRQPADNREHYRRRLQLDEPALRAVLGLEDGEPFPDLSTMPPELLETVREFTSPLGTYFDAYPIHFVTTGWLDELRGHRPSSRFEALRFRPNFLIETEDSSTAERTWMGKTLRVGGVTLQTEAPTVRCSMTVQQTGDLPKDPQVLRTLVQKTGQFVGSYASVAQEGTIEVGAPVELV